MAFERVAIFGLIDVDLECTGQGALRLSTDLPGNAMAVRETKVFAATARRVVRFRLQGSTKGRLYVFNILPVVGVMRLYGARIWARVLPGTTWDWYTVPVPPTSEEWTATKLPIAPVGEWTPAPLPVPPTSKDWTPSKLPIAEVSEWSQAKLPIKPTPATPTWIDIPTDD